MLSVFFGNLPSLLMSISTQVIKFYRYLPSGMRDAAWVLRKKYWQCVAWVRHRDDRLKRRQLGLSEADKFTNLNDLNRLQLMSWDGTRRIVLKRHFITMD